MGMRRLCAKNNRIDDFNQSFDGFYRIAEVVFDTEQNVRIKVGKFCPNAVTSRIRSTVLRIVKRYTSTSLLTSIVSLHF